MSTRLVKMREQVMAQLHAAQGALQVIDTLLAEEPAMTEQQLAEAIARGTESDSHESSNSESGIAANES